MSSVNTVRSEVTLRGQAEQRKAGASRKVQGAVKALEDKAEETVNWVEVYILGMEQWKDGKPLYVSGYN